MSKDVRGVVIGAQQCITCRRDVTKPCRKLVSRTMCEPDWCKWCARGLSERARCAELRFYRVSGSCGDLEPMADDVYQTGGV